MLNSHIRRAVKDLNYISEVLNHQQPPIASYDHAQLVNVLSELEQSDAKLTEISRKYGISASNLDKWSRLYMGISPTQIAHFQSVTYNQKDYCPEQIVAILAVLQRPGVTCVQVSQEYHVSQVTLLLWRQNYANKSVEEVRTLRLARRRAADYSADKIFAVLQDFVASDMSQSQICLKHGVSKSNFNNWRQKYLNKSAAEIAQLQVEARSNGRFRATTVAPTARLIPQDGVDIAMQQSLQVCEGGQRLLLNTPRLLRTHQQLPQGGALRELELEGKHVMQFPLNMLYNTPNLERLTVKEGENFIFPTVKLQLPKLAFFSLFGASVGVRGLHFLTRSPALQSLTLVDCPNIDRLPQKRHFSYKQLTYLKIEDTPFALNGFIILASNTGNLEQVELAKIYKIRQENCMKFRDYETPLAEKGYQLLAAQNLRLQ